MVNQRYLKFLANLESAAPIEDRALINSIRGNYVKRECSDDKYIQFLGKLESIASPADQEHINTIRGAYAMLEMGIVNNLKDEPDVAFSFKQYIRLQQDLGESNPKYFTAGIIEELPSAKKMVSIYNSAFNTVVRILDEKINEVQIKYENKDNKYSAREIAHFVKDAEAYCDKQTNFIYSSERIKHFASKYSAAIEKIASIKSIPSSRIKIFVKLPVLSEQTTPPHIFNSSISFYILNKFPQGNTGTYLGTYQSIGEFINSASHNFSNNPLLHQPRQDKVTSEDNKDKVTRSDNKDNLASEYNKKQANEYLKPVSAKRLHDPNCGIDPDARVKKVSINPNLRINGRTIVDPDEYADIDDELVPDVDFASLFDDPDEED